MKSLLASTLCVLCAAIISFAPASESPLWYDVEAQFQRAMLGERAPGNRDFRRLFPSGETGSIQGRTPSVTPSHRQGGPGSSGAYRYLNRQVADPVSDLTWHQNTWREHWQQTAETMKELEQTLAPLLAVDLNTLSADQTSGGTSWPARCLTYLRNAHEQGDTAAIAHWQAEYRAALEWAQDLVAWGHLLAHNQLSNLDFQQANSELFPAMVPAYQNLRGGYNANSHVGRFPAGTNGLYGIWNWLEVERQADLLLAPDAQWQELASQPLAHASILAVPPPYRAAAAQIRQALPQNAQTTWDQALSAPYERSFVIAALGRYQHVQSLEHVAQVMTLAAQQWPRQEIPLWALMDALPWRAGDSFAGMEWADRFSPAVSKLIPQRMPNQIPQRFAALHQLVHSRYQQCEYSGLVLTLREALQRNSMDCIRVTDLYGALWRNMGQAGFLPVRQIRAGMGHTIAGLILFPGDRREVILSMDGMIGENQPRRWPDTAGGGQSGELVCNELFYRGLDGYVFLEGVIVRGSQAGTRIQAAVPWLPGREEAARSNLARSP